MSKNNPRKPKPRMPQGKFQGGRSMPSSSAGGSSQGGDASMELDFGPDGEERANVESAGPAEAEAASNVPAQEVESGPPAPRRKVSEPASESPAPPPEESRPTPASKKEGPGKRDDSATAPSGTQRQRPAAERSAGEAGETEERRSSLVVEEEFGSAGSAKAKEENAEATAETDAEDEPTGRKLRSEAAADAAKQPLTKLDRIGSIAALVVLPVLFIAIAVAILSRRPEGDGDQVKRKPDLPMKGDLVSITKVESGWRVRRDTDHVKPGMIPITREDKKPDELPALRLEVDADSSKTAFVRVLFRRGERIEGDSRVFKVSEGKVFAMTKAEEVVGDREIHLAASTGIADKLQLYDYFAGTQERWAVEISESSSYQASGEQWKLLDYFAIDNKEL
jgi:hypothetical protein